MKKNILFVMSSLRNGGAERSLVNLLQLFDYDKYSVDLILFQPEGMFLSQFPAEVNILDNCEVLHVLYETDKRRIINFKHPVLSVAHVVTTLVSKKRVASADHSRQYRWAHYYKRLIPRQEKKYDTAIAYLQGEPTYYLVDKVSANRKIAWVHTDYAQTAHDRKMDFEYYSRVDQVVTISDICVDSLKQEFPSIEEKFCMLPNITSSSIIRNLAKSFYPEEFCKKDFKIVSVGRLHAVKGFDLALEAAAVLKGRGVNFKWYVLGDGELKNELEQQCRELGLQDRFFFLGARENPYVYMHHADVVVQSSKYEGKSVVLDEAKILYRTIVSTNYPSVYDQLNENEGIIVEMNKESLADGIEKAIQSKDIFEEYLFNQEYGNQHVIQEYYKIIGAP